MGMPILSNNSTLSFKKKPLDKENSVHIHKITLFIHNEELHYGICRKVDHYVGEIRKAGWQIFHVFSKGKKNRLKNNMHSCIHIELWKKRRRSRGNRYKWTRESKRICVSWKQKGRVVEWRRSARGEQELGAHPNRRMANDKVSISMCEKKSLSEIHFFVC